MSTEVLSIRIKKDIKRKAERLNLNIRDIIEKALAEAIEQAKRKRLEEAINALLLEMKEISEDEWIETVKECRKER